MKRLKIVIDTNLWISFIISSKQESLIKLLLQSDSIVYSCKEMVSELESVLRREKFRKYLQLPVPDYIAFHQEITVSTEIIKNSIISKDPKDNYLIDLATMTQSNYLITGDKQLRSLKKVGQTEFITYADFKHIVDKMKETN